MLQLLKKQSKTHIASWKILLKCIKSLRFGQFSSFSSSLAVSCTSCTTQVPGGLVKSSWDKPSSQMEKMRPRCVPATRLEELRCDWTAQRPACALLISSPLLPAHSTLHTPVLLSALTMNYLRSVFWSVLCITAPGYILECKSVAVFHLYQSCNYLCLIL